MAGTVEQIQQEIAAIEQVIATTAEELRVLYDRYLTSLGQSVRQQLIQAGFYLCTQGYPEQFLRLTLGQRQQLQQHLRQLAQQSQQLLSHDQLMKAQAERTEVALLSLPEAALVGPDPADDAEAPTFPPEKSPAAEEHPFGALLRSSRILALLEWQEQLEAAIVTTLQLISHQANHALQQAGLIPPHLPKALLEMAVKTEAGSESGTGVPNILSFLVEAVSENAAEQDKPDDYDPVEPLGLPPLPLRVIHLHLAEIEFHDAQVMVWRTKIRTLFNKVRVLARDYRKKQQERAIAEAEAAWRTSWFDE